ncbi:MAG: 30S ribosomal protein S18 [Candidatus Moranbacteria bacterium]|jgi:small subunit ribosomal protein S18|nr:30S ribosomal protein S18 [Candidatus Moranbacteria bacterium]MDQ5976346.1 small subunit ribosomal protein [Patescibacteria group bacterium]
MTLETKQLKKLALIDYKDAYFLRKFMNSQGKMYPPKKHGLSAKQQRRLAQAVKRARFMALVPYVVK